MKININEITIKVKNIPAEERPHPNLLANAFLTLKEESDSYFTISGFTVWKSKNYKGYNVKVPQKHNFDYCSFEKSLWQKLKKEIISEYERSTIPIIEK